MNNSCKSKLTNLCAPHRICALWILSLLLLGALPSKAQPNPGPGTLAVASISGTAGYTTFLDSVRFTFGYGRGARLYGIFSTLLLTTNDVGKVFPITQADDTNFTFLVAILTNGVSDLVGYTLEGGGLATSEQAFFAPLPAGGNNIDFAGFHIDNIALQIDALTFNASDLWTDLSWSFRLYVNSEPWARPSILTPPQNQMADVGSIVDFVISAAGNPPLGYQWFFNGTNSLSGRTNDVLEFTIVQPDQAGAYTVVVTNAFGAVTSAPAMLSVTASPPVILSAPSSQTAAMGSTVDFVVSADGAPPPACQWFFNGTNALGGATNAVLELVHVQPAQAGAYTVVITNAAGAVTSPPAVLTVLDPAIVTQPANQLAMLGATASFSVVAAGTAPLGFQWFKDSAQLNDGGNTSGAQTAALTLAAVSSRDAGGYCVVISNPSGSVTSLVAVLTITNAYYSVVHRFTGDDGSSSVAALAASGSTLYGTTSEGGSSGYGTVFKVNTDGSGYALLHRYNHDDGVGPCGDLLLSGTTLYGTTYMGGANNYGTVFRLGIDGSNFWLLQQFNYQDGGEPYAGLALSDTSLYGVTSFSPVLFRVSPDGSGYTVLRRFTSDDGGGPSGSGSLVLSGETLYGTTGGGSDRQPFGTCIQGQHGWERLHRPQKLRRQRRDFAERGTGAFRGHAVRHDS